MAKPGATGESDTKRKAEQDPKIDKEAAEREKAEQEAKEKAEKEKAEQEAKAKAEKEKADQEVKAKAEQEAKEKAEHEAKAKADQEAKAKVDQEANEKPITEKAEQEVQVKADQEEAKAKADNEVADKAEQEANEKLDKEAANKPEQESKPKEGAEEKGVDKIQENSDQGVEKSTEQDVKPAQTDNETEQGTSEAEDGAKQPAAVSQDSNDKEGTQDDISLNKRRQKPVRSHYQFPGGSKSVIIRRAATIKPNEPMLVQLVDPFTLPSKPAEPEPSDEEKQASPTPVAKPPPGGVAMPMIAVGQLAGFKAGLRKTVGAAQSNITGAKRAQPPASDPTTPSPTATTTTTTTTTTPTATTATAQPTAAATENTGEKAAVATVTTPVQSVKTSLAASAPVLTRKPAIATAPPGTIRPYADLKERRNVQDLDMSMLEAYLSDAEFETIMGANRPDFQKLPRWKQTAKKKEVGLF
eukprot:TRINITY_DN779_c2_g1_i12.p1 TRINITY_DN779_c2_g1~~TRINITY_DN779_c2_g1_i12.p1  ORF type:complete len:470 (-),score=153.58 TRINITY_DN779_c2_g1_i12:1432-2841(-)